MTDAGARFALAQLQTGAEVHQDNPAAVFAHDVLGLDVAMHETGRMHGREGLTEILTDERGLARAPRAIGREQRLERAPANELHAQPGAPVPLLGVVHDDDVRVLDAGERASLVQHAVDQAVAPAVDVQELDRHLALQLRIARAIDVAERALADKLEELETSPTCHSLGLAEVLRDRGRLGGGHVVRRWARAYFERQQAGDGVGARAQRALVLAQRTGFRALDVRDLREEADLAQQLAVAVVVELDRDQTPVDRARSLHHGIDGTHDRVAAGPHDASLIADSSFAWLIFAISCASLSTARRAATRAALPEARPSSAAISS